jgi:hypothetical protein
MVIVYIDKCQYEILELKEVVVWYTVIYRPILSTAYSKLTRISPPFLIVL